LRALDAGARLLDALGELAAITSDLDELEALADKRVPHELRVKRVACWLTRREEREKPLAAQSANVSRDLERIRDGWSDANNDAFRRPRGRIESLDRELHLARCLHNAREKRRLRRLNQ
jgi:hypothetical protein